MSAYKTATRHELLGQNGLSLVLLLNQFNTVRHILLEIQYVPVWLMHKCCFLVYAEYMILKTLGLTLSICLHSIIQFYETSWQFLHSLQCSQFINSVMEYDDEHVQYFLLLLVLGQHVQCAFALWEKGMVVRNCITCLTYFNFTYSLIAPH